MTDNITVRARAKINLFLNVLSKREDGYHEVDNVMHSVTLCDEVTLRRRGEGVTLSCSDPALSSPEENIACRAASLFFRRFPELKAGIDINIEKRIPVAAGLAGGSADAAAVLSGMDRLFGTGMTEHELRELGTMIGMDVPFCLTGGCSRASGRGELLSPLPRMPECLILIAVGRERISTPRAYAALDSRPFRPDVANLVPDALERGDLAAVCSAMFNCFESVTDLHSEIKRVMLGCGALNAMMSGSGPSVFGVFPPDGKNELEKAKSRLGEMGYRTYGAAGG